MGEIDRLRVLCWTHTELHYLPNGACQVPVSSGGASSVRVCASPLTTIFTPSRLQIQHGKGAADNLFTGPVQATRRILSDYGFSRLYQGWWSTCWREVPAFGLYFAVYDYLKDLANTFFCRQAGLDPAASLETPHAHTWAASMIAGGFAGSLSWGSVYPIDAIKTRIQCSPLDTSRSQLTMWRVGSDIVAQYGVRHLFRGLGITLLRAFPVNATIFPVYEFTLMQVSRLSGT